MGSDVSPARRNGERLIQQSALFDLAPPRHPPCRVTIEALGWNGMGRVAKSSRLDAGFREATRLYLAVAQLAMCALQPVSGMAHAEVIRDSRTVVATFIKPWRLLLILALELDAVDYERRSAASIVKHRL